MVSNSTKKKHRQKLLPIPAHKKVAIDFVDSRVDFWVVSVKITNTFYNHHEVYGKKKAFKLFRTLMSIVHRPEISNTHLGPLKYISTHPV